MKKILTLGASTSKNSINKQLAYWAANQIENVQIQLLDLNEFDLPLYSVDNEKRLGEQKACQKFLDKIRTSDGIIISMAEHNGSYTAAFKNILDWTTRIEKNLWHGKPMLILATSPGARGAYTVLKSAALSFPHFGANVIETFSLPSFYENFKDDKILDEGLKRDLLSKIEKFKDSI
mgnify:CR=1 FL=1